jgi:SAM-dependent methyltransferase
MSKPSHTAQQYWDARSELFAAYYKTPSLFDRVFRKGVYTRTAFTLQVIKEFTAPSILDIGSGPGINSITWLKNSPGSTLFGIDFAQSMVDYARTAAKAEGLEKRARFEKGDFLEWDFKGEKFDVSSACGVFDYIRDAGPFLKRMAEVTSKAFVASWPENGLRMALRRYRYTCPVFHYTEEQIRDLHKKTGVTDFEVVKMPAGWMSVGRWR